MPRYLIQKDPLDFSNLKILTQGPETMNPLINYLIEVIILQLQAKLGAMESDYLIKKKDKISLTSKQEKITVNLN